MEFIKPIIWKAGVLDFFFLPVSNSGSAIIKPYGLWQGRASQVVIFLYFWHGTCFNKKVAPVLAVTECYRCDKNSRGVWKSEREREQKKWEKDLSVAPLRYWQGSETGVGTSPAEQVFPLSLCLLFSKNQSYRGTHTQRGRSKLPVKSYEC